ncbi:GntR family transcriptional regulator [Brevibacterium luteolum]|uniref:GntR family transcriptional regulator n=1 Tax=Brevibacterium luteolum TaxID=199591 RepID=UPI00223A95E2|nr:GntR family transcriptional regulator [Brevibacterium luteolum]MCT1656856.1 GntR family transcriptional regulator [Brevibacterium luteolum]
MTSSDHPSPPHGKTQYVYEWLRERIMSGAMSPGQPLRQNAIAKKLGVSASPVREAFRRLESVGLISHTDNLGAAVSELNETDVEEVYLLRGVMEGLAAKLAARKRTAEDLARLHDKLLAAERLAESEFRPAEQAKLSREFHNEIAMIGSPNVIAPRVQQLWWTYPIPQSTSLWADREWAKGILAVHRRLYEAVEHGDEIEAERLCRDHVHATGRKRVEEAERLI